jgi:hypothetical protein
MRFDPLAKSIEASTRTASVAGSQTAMVPAVVSSNESRSGLPTMK